MTKTAAQLMAELNEDKNYQVKISEQNKRIKKLKNTCKLDEEILVSELQHIGFSVNSIWDFVNKDCDYLKALPVLIKHLNIPHHPRILSGVARSLAVPAFSSSDELWSALTELYDKVLPDKTIDTPEERGAQESVAVALESLATSSRINDLKKIIQHNQNGDGIVWLREKLKIL